MKHLYSYIVYRACVGLPPINHMLLEHKVPQLMKEFTGTPTTGTLTIPLKPVMKDQPLSDDGGIRNEVTTNGYMNGVY